MRKLLSLIDWPGGWEVRFCRNSWTFFYPSAYTWFAKLCETVLRDQPRSRGQIVYLHVATVCPESPTDWLVLDEHETLRRTWVTEDGHSIQFCAEGLAEVFGKQDIPRLWVKPEFSGQLAGWHDSVTSVCESK